MTYGNNLRQLQQNVALKKQLETKLNELREQKKVFERKVTALRVAHQCEQEDVEKLESKRLANYFYRFIGKLEDKLTEERRQAAAAGVKLDAAEHALSSVVSQIQELQSQLQGLYGSESAYSAALKKKRVELKESGDPTGAELLELEESIAFLNSQKQEIKEALSAGRDAMRAADRILTELKSASDWNTWDIIGSDSIITHMAKHSHLDNAQASIIALQSTLRHFKTELADIHIQADMQLNVDGFLRFADYFFDGLFADWAVGDRIHQSQSSVLSVRHKIEQAINKLTAMNQAADQQIAALNTRIEERIINT